jgi:hypothetical protein
MRKKQKAKVSPMNVNNLTLANPCNGTKRKEISPLPVTNKDVVPHNNTVISMFGESDDDEFSDFDVSGNVLDQLNISLRPFNYGHITEKWNSSSPIITAF